MEYIEIMHLVNGNIHVSAQDKERWNKNGYDEIQKVAPYLYEAWYSNLDYAKADRYFRTKAVPVTPSGCSAVRMGAFYGRNLDWYYNNQAEIMVHTKHEHGRNAVFGICSSMGGLDDAFVSSGMYSELYDYVPFMLVDGINEHGLVVNTNVVPAGEKGNNSYINRGSSSNVDICSLMLVRYLLDKCSSVADVKSFFNEHPKIYQPLTLLKGGFEQHFMVADESSTAIIEFINGGVQFIEDDKPIMTNFHLSGVSFNDDGTVTTPAQITDNLIAHPNGITAHGAGLERYNIAVGDYSKTYVKEEMLNLMEKMYYTNAYSLDYPVSERWNTEFVGIDGLVSYSKGVDYADTYERIANKHKTASRAESNFWQTVHSVVYDIENKTATIRIQEEHQTTCVRELDAIDYEAIKDLIKKEEGEPTLDELIEKAINTGDTEIVNKAKVQILAIDDKTRLQYLGAGLAKKGYEPYKYAGLTSKDGFDGKNIPSFDYSLMSLENGTQMFMGSNVITSFNAETPILSNGQDMFNGCTNLVSVEGHFDKLTDGKGMFEGCILSLESVCSIATNINTIEDGSKPWLTLGLGCSYNEYSQTGSEWQNAVNTIESKGWDAKIQCTVDIDKLVRDTIASGNKDKCQKVGAFAADTGIEEYKYAGAQTVNELKSLGYTGASSDMNIMSLGEGEYLFSNDNTLSSFETPVPSLVDGSHMFENTGDISVTVNAPNLTNAREMFHNSNVSSITLIAPKMTNIDNTTDMFNPCEKLKKVSLTLSSITSVQDLFNHYIVQRHHACENVVNIELYAPRATNANWTVLRNPSIETFKGDLHQVTTASGMFLSCNKLKSFECDLSSLQVANEMFNGCTSLTHFDASLGNLINGNLMFDGCQLNLSSIQKIAQSLHEGECQRTIHIGMGGDMTQAHKDAFTAMSNKGWTVVVNGSEFKTPIYYGDNLTTAQAVQYANSITDCKGRDVIFHVAESEVDWTGWEEGSTFWEGLIGSIPVFDAWQILINKNCGNKYIKTIRTGNQLIAIPMF